MYIYFYVERLQVFKKTPMKDLGKNTVKPQIKNVILYIQTNENCETKFFPL